LDDLVICAIGEWIWPGMNIFLSIRRPWSFPSIWKAWSKGSPDGVQRNPGQRVAVWKGFPDFAGAASRLRVCWFGWWWDVECSPDEVKRNPGEGVAVWQGCFLDSAVAASRLRVVVFEKEGSPDGVQRNPGVSGVVTADGIISAQSGGRRNLFFHGDTG
jgi:hypothetical protein